MLGLFKNKTSHHPRPALSVVAPVAYHANLINRLEKEHRRLLSLHESIQEDCRQGNITAIHEGLNAFAQLLNQHIETENQQLYSYLQQHIASNDINSKLVRFFQREIDDVTRPALEFIEQQTCQSEINEAAIEHMNRLFNEIHARMRREEKTLFPLYAPY